MVGVLGGYNKLQVLYINYIIHSKIKKDNHHVPKIVRVTGNKANPKKKKYQ